MKLKTSLQLSAIFPVVFATAVVVMARWEAGTESSSLSISSLAVFGLLGITMAAIILSYSREVLNKIDILNNWIDAVVKGDLDHRIDIKPSDDEVGRLSQGLSKMLKELKEAYASLQQEARQQKELVLQHKKGEETSQTTVKHVMNALGRVKQLQDDTVRQERLRVVEQIIRRTTHDLSEAMVPIVGTCDLLVSHPETLSDPKEALASVQTMQGGADRLKKLLKNLAMFFPAVDEAAGPTDANSAVEDALKLARPYWDKQAGAQKRIIEIKTHLDVIPAVAVEESDLRDALVSLILNSVEALPEGGVISITTRGDASGVSVEVRDTGVGMTEDVRSRCTDPFFSTKKGTGTGMGLTFVAGLVRRSRGRLDIESKPNMGTRVSLGLPIWTKKQKKEAAPVEAPGTDRLRILVVDDDLPSLTMVARLLTMERYVVETASSGLEGLDKMKPHSFDVAVIDRAMPGMNGDELAGRIKEISPETAVMMLTGFGDIMIEEGEMPDHIDLLVSKPVTGRELCEGVKKALESNKAKLGES